MRYLVTGGAGFIGSHLVEALVREGSSAVVLDDLSTGRRENIEPVLEREEVTLVEGSVTDASLVEELMAEVDACAHLASAVGVQLVVSNPLDSLDTNIRGNQTVISSAARLRRPLLYTSTSEVYGKNTDGALNEDSDRVLGSSLKSRWNYAIAKSYGEALIHAFHREKQAPATVVRLFNTVGPRQTGRYGMVLPRLVRQALDGRDLTIYGDGSQTRCFAHVNDSVRALTSLLRREDVYGRAFNVGSSAELSILELGKRVIDRTESRSKVTFISYEDAYGEGFEELGERRPDTTALAELTGWQPTLTIDDAIDDVIAHERGWSVSRQGTASDRPPARQLTALVTGAAVLRRRRAGGAWPRGPLSHE